MNETLTRPESTVLFLGITVLCVCGIWALIRWLVHGPSSPDPWDEQTSKELASEDATPLCPRCLSSVEDVAYFCPHCGAPVGPYTNLLPFPYLFSIGDELRIGSSGRFNRTPLVVAGFILLGLAEYVLLAPLYWLMFLLNLGRQPRQPPPSDTPSQAAPQGS